MSPESSAPANPSRGRNWTGIAQLALLAIAIIVALYLARAPARVERGPLSASGDAVPVVEVFLPSSSQHMHHVDLTGTVTLDRKLAVVSEVVGRVIWVSPEFVNGGSVQANEVFVKVDPTEYELEVRAAEMAVAEAEAEVQIARRIAEQHDGLSVARAEARLGRTQADLALAELRLARTEIKLPYAARVISAELEVGDLVGPSDEVGRRSVLGVVYRPEALQVRVPIAVEGLIAVEPAIGRIAQVDTEFGTYDAVIARTSSVVALETRLARAFLKFSSDIPTESLPVPGTFAEVRIFGPTWDDVFILPEAATREHGTVWVVKEGTLQSRTPATVGHTSDGWIVEAFDAGDGVVVSTLSGASEGLSVSASPTPVSQ